MKPLNPALEPFLGPLKDFQRRTVDYVFQRMYLDDPPARRFLIADEVGLGKTLVARGILARALHHLYDHVDRIDIIYVCSNAAIARQNLNRLNVTGRRDLAFATRLTLLPAQIKNLKGNRVNLVSFTPGTTFDLKSRGGQKAERADMYFMLREALDVPRRGLKNLLQCTVERENWHRYLKSRPEVVELDVDLSQGFARKVRKDRRLYGAFGGGMRAVRPLSPDDSGRAGPTPVRPDRRSPALPGGRLHRGAGAGPGHPGRVPAISRSAGARRRASDRGRAAGPGSDAPRTGAGSPPVRYAVQDAHARWGRRERPLSGFSEDRRIPHAGRSGAREVARGLPSLSAPAGVRRWGSGVQAHP